MGANIKLFGGRLKEASKRAGLSQKALAEGAGVSVSAIQQYTAGIIEPTRPVLCALAQIIGVSLEGLATGEGTMEKSLVSPDNPLDLKLLTDIIQLIEEHLKHDYFFEREMPSDKKAEVIALIYEDCMEKEVIDEKRIVRFLKLAV
jgi:transcriptional regulator with XRE-family HTH domain